MQGQYIQGSECLSLNLARQLHLVTMATAHMTLGNGEHVCPLQGVRSM